MNPYQAISTIMTPKPFCLDENVSYYQIKAAFEEHDFHHILIVDQQEELKGIVSRKDVAKIEHTLTLQTSGRTYSVNTLLSTPASRIMTPNPVVLNVDDTIGFAADIFLVNRIHALPIVDDNQLVGIVTTHDLLKFAFNKIPLTAEE